VIGALVMLLWGMILAERAIIRQAQQDHYEFLRSQPIMGPNHLEPKPARDITDSPADDSLTVS
jgi:hypothetical protein